MRGTPLASVMLPASLSPSKGRLCPSPPTLRSGAPGPCELPRPLLSMAAIVAHSSHSELPKSPSGSDAIGGI